MRKAHKAFMLKNGQLMKEKEELREARELCESKLSAKENEVPMIQSDQSEHEEDDPDDHEGEYSGGETKSTMKTRRKKKIMRRKKM